MECWVFRSNIPSLHTPAPQGVIMKRIVICFDGTWNKPAAESLPADQQVETNVRRFYESLKDRAPDGTAQIKWYDQGVGTQCTNPLSGGAPPAGVELKIFSGGRFLPTGSEKRGRIF